MTTRHDMAAGDAPASALGLWRVFGASKRVLALSIISGFIAGSSSAWQMAIVNKSLTEGQAVSTILVPTFFGLIFLSLFSGALSVTLLSRLAQDNQYKLRLWLVRRVLSAPLRQLQSCGPHRLMAALTEDVVSVVGAQETLPHLFVESAKILAAFVYLGTLSLNLLGLVLIFVVFGVFTYSLAQKQTMRWVQLARQADNVLFGHLRTITEGAKELKMDSRRRRAFLEEDLIPTADQLKKRQNTANLIYVLANNWSESLYFLVIGIILFLVPQLSDAPRASLTGFTLAILFIGAPLSVLFNAAPAVGRGVVALRNIGALGLGSGESGEILPQVAPSGDLPRPPALELRSISYRHQGQDGERGYAIGPLDLRIRPGELVFVTGGNGSGKTTLALVLLGLYAPDAGEIRIGGELVTERNRESYRQNFSAVFADAYVFDSLLGYSQASSLSRAQELLALLRLDKKLSVVEGKFSTVKLSQGERKRLALLAAYISDRPFFLFDEWAADQDPAFREFFYLQMLPELKSRGKTVVVMTHDDRYFHLCDRLLRLNLGQIEKDMLLSDQAQLRAVKARNDV